MLCQGSDDENCLVGSGCGGRWLDLAVKKLLRWIRPSQRHLSEAPAHYTVLTLTLPTVAKSIFAHISRIDAILSDAVLNYLLNLLHILPENQIMCSAAKCQA